MCFGGWLGAGMGTAWMWPLLAGGVILFVIGLPGLRRQLTPANAWQPLAGLFFALIAVRELSGGNSGPAALPLAIAVGVTAVAGGLCAVTGATRPARAHPGSIGDRDLATKADAGLLAFRRYERTGDAAELEQAITSFRDVLPAMDTSHPARAIVLSNLGTALRVRFGRTGADDDLAEAVAVGRQAIDVAPTGDPRRCGYLSNLGMALWRQGVATQEPARVDEAVDLLRRSIASSAAEDPDHAGFRGNLALILCDRFERLGRPADLDDAIDAVRAAGTDGAMLGNLLRRRFGMTGRPEDLQEAVHLVEHALAVAGAADRTALLATLSDALCQRFEVTGALADLDRAIKLGREALAGTPSGHPDHAGWRSNLGLALRHRFERTGDRSDLEEAIELGRQAVATSPDHSDRRVRAMANLAGALQDRSARTGARADLDDAIHTARQVVAAMSADSHDRPNVLSDLAGKLIARFKWSGGQADIDEAIDLARQAIAMAPADDPAQARYLAGIGGMLVDRFGRTGRRADLDEAIDFGRRAVAARVTEHAARIVALNNLSIALLARARQSVAGTDARGARGYLVTTGRAIIAGRYVEEAISVARRAVAATPTDHAYYAGTLGNLGGALIQRAMWSGRPDRMDAAIETVRQAATAAADQPDQTWLLVNLGLALEARFELTGRRADREEALASYRAAVAATAAPPVIRAGAARAWLDRAESDGDDTSALDALSAAVGLLPTLAWHGLDRRSRERHLTDWSGLAADAAACAIRAGEPRRAVELLEQGRSVLWNQVLHIRGDLSALAERAPDVAARLDRIRSVLDNPAGGPFPDPTLAPDPVARDARMRLAREWDELIARVRQLDGFEHFLAATPFAELRHAADAGPVVIVNVSRHRCDALIVAGSTVTPVALPDLTLTAATEHAGNLQSALDLGTRPDAPFLDRERLRHTVHDTLDWLWDTVSEPVLDAIGISAPPATGARIPHLWWCPTGPLAFLPLHAAGHHPRGTAAVRTRRDSVPDRVISSYTSTLGALLRARRRADTSAPTMLAIGIPDAPDGVPLPAVTTEMTRLREHFPQRGDQLLGPDATRDAVRQHLATHPWVHIACHADHSRADPATSAVRLWDGPLTVLDIAEQQLDHAELAYLSACQTASGAHRLPDESIHIAAALQLAGFRHVIATLWSVHDEHAPTVADAVYRQLTAAGAPDATDTAHALHHATAQLRADHPTDPTIWAPYLHTGT